MAYELAFVLTGESDELEAALQQATQEERELESATEEVMRSQIRWNDEVKRFISQNGKFVSALDAGKELREELNQLGVQTTEQLEQEIQRLETLEAAYQDDAYAAAQLAQRKQMLNDQLEQASQGMQGFSRQTAGAEQILFSLGDGIEDAQYGFRGVSNNISFTAEQFSNLISRTGSARAAFSALAGSMLGAGGVIVGIQLLMNLGPKLISFFNRSEKAAKEKREELERLAEAYRSAARAVTEFEATIDDETVRFTSATIGPGIRNVREELEARRLQLQTSEDQLEKERQTLEALKQKREILQDNGRLTDERAQEIEEEISQRRENIRHLERQIPKLEESITQHEEALGNLEDQREEWENKTELQQIYLNAGGELVELEETSAEAQKEGLSALEEALKTQKELRGELEFLQTAEGERLLRIEQQNRELERQLEFERLLFRLRQSGVLDRRRAGPMGPSAEDAPDLLEEAYEERRQQEEELTDFVVEEARRRGLLRTDEEKEALKRFKEQARQYTMTAKDMYEQRRRDHKAMLEEMEMNQAEWLFTSLEGMQLLGQMSAEVFGGIGELARATFDRRVQQAVRSYDEEAAALRERGLTEKEIVEELGKTREEARKDAEEQNRRFFQFQKAAAIADAVVNTYAAANEALASAPPPFNYALAAGVVAAGLANVQKIRSQQIGGPARAGSRGSRYNSPYETTGERDPRRRQRSGSNAPSINAPPRPSRASSSQRIEFVHRFEEAELHGDTIRYAIRESERRENR